MQWKSYRFCAKGCGPAGTCTMTRSDESRSRPSEDRLWPGFLYAACFWALIVAGALVVG